jgi:hypothetical protein
MKVDDIFCQMITRRKEEEKGRQANCDHTLILFSNKRRYMLVSSTS